MSEAYNSKSKSAKPESAIDDAEKSTSFWFDAGNIILEVEGTRYRLHHNVLSYHSGFFRDLLVVAHPEKIDAIGEADSNILRLQDRSNDWDLLLEIIYNPFQHYDGLKDYPIQYVIAMARLGHKYQFDLLEKFARQRIKSIFPVTLAEWKSSTISEVNSELYASIAEYQFDLISIATKIHLRTVLPCMYLMCIWDLESASKIYAYSPGLDPTELRILAIGWDKCLDHILTFLKSTFDDTDEPTTFSCLQPGNPSSCERRKVRLLKRMLPGKAKINSPILKSDASLDYLHLCESCSSDFKDLHADSLEKFWESLPGIFGLEPWSALKDQI